MVCTKSEQKKILHRKKCKEIRINLRILSAIGSGDRKSFPPPSFESLFNEKVKTGNSFSLSSKTLNGNTVARVGKTEQERKKGMASKLLIARKKVWRIDEAIIRRENEGERDRKHLKKEEDLQLTWRRMLCCRSEDGMFGFSDLHDKCFPLSLMSGMKETVEMLVLESLEWLSSTSFRIMTLASDSGVGDDDLNHEIWGRGLDPMDWHLNSILFPAMIDVRGGINLTWSGFKFKSMNVDAEISWVKFVLDALHTNSFIRLERFSLRKCNSL